MCFLVDVVVDYEAFFTFHLTSVYCGLPQDTCYQQRGKGTL